MRKEMIYQADRKIEILETGTCFGLLYYILNLGTHPTAYVRIPKIPKSDIGNIGRADKEAARLYIQGVKIKNNPKETILSMIYFELKRMNVNQMKGEEENEDN